MSLADEGDGDIAKSSHSRLQDASGAGPGLSFERGVFIPSDNCLDPSYEEECLHQTNHHDDGESSSSRDLLEFTSRSQIMLLFAASLASLATAASRVAQAVLLGGIFNVIAGYGSGDRDSRNALDEVSTWCVKMLWLGLASWLIHAAFLFLWTVFGELQANGARVKVFHCLLHRKLAWFDVAKQGISSMLVRTQTQTRELQLATSQVLGFAIRDAATAVASILAALCYSWEVTLALCATLPFSLAVLSCLSRQLQPALIKQKLYLQRGSRVASSAVAAIELVKIHNGGENEVHRYRHATTLAANFYLVQSWCNCVQMGYLAFAVIAMFVLGFWYGATLVRDGLPPGHVITAFHATLTACHTLEAIASQLLVISRGIQGGSYLARLTAVAEDEEEGSNCATYDPYPGDHATEHPPGGLLRSSCCHGQILLRNISFAYSSNPTKAVLKASSCVFPCGQLTYVIGHSGCGKSTIGHLIASLYKPQEGQILLDGQPYEDLGDDLLRKTILLVQQTSVIFNDSIFHNVALGHPTQQSCTASDVLEACRFSLLLPAIASLPLGLDTRIGPSGHQLSGGQSQMIALARARLRDPPILVLDEVTSGLDQRNRAQIFESIRKWRSGRTTIILTHDTTLINDDEHVCLMADATVSWQGSKRNLPSCHFLQPHTDACGDNDLLPIQTKVTFKSSSVRSREAADGANGESQRYRGSENPLHSPFIPDDQRSRSLSIARLPSSPASKQTQVLHDQALLPLSLLENFILGWRLESWCRQAKRQAIQFLARFTSRLNSRSPSLYHEAGYTSLESLRQPKPLQSSTRNEAGCVVLTKKTPEFMPTHPGLAPERYTLTGQQEIVRPCKETSWGKNIGSTTHRHGLLSCLISSQNDTSSIECDQAELGVVKGAEFEPLVAQQNEYSPGYHQLPTALEPCNLVSEENESLKRSPQGMLKVEEVKFGAYKGLFEVLGTVWRSLDHGSKGKFTLGCFLCALGGASTSLFASFLASLLEALWSQGDPKSESRQWAARLILTALVDGLCTCGGYFLLEKVGQLWVDHIRVEAFRHLLHQPVSWFDEPRHSPGQISECLESNAEEMRYIVGRFIPCLTTTFTAIFASVAWAMTISWQFTMTALVPLPFVAIAVNLFAATNSRWESRCKEGAQGTGALMTEVLLNVRAVRSLNAETHFASRYLASTQHTLSLGMQRAKRSCALYGFYQSTTYALLALVVYRGMLTLSETPKSSVVDVLQIVNLLFFSVGTLTELLESIPQLTRAQAAARQLLDYARLSVEPRRRGRSSNEVLPVRVRNMNYSYPREPFLTVLRGITLDVLAGECVAIVGRSGSGKSTLAALLLGLRVPSPNHCNETPPVLSYADMPFFDVDVRQIRSSMAYVPQKPFVFPATVAGNIAYGLTVTSRIRGEVEQAARAAGLHDFIATLPHAYDTLLGEGGQSLSGGQSQRLGVARALFRKPRLMVLDEPTSALDADNVNILCNTIQTSLRNRRISEGKMAVVLITHNVQMMRLADRILVLDKGALVQQGCYDDLINSPGTFRDILEGRG